MTSNKLTIRINKPISEVFSWTINPENTALWIDGMNKEEADLPIQVGSHYRNYWGAENKMNEYILTQFEENKLFQLESVSGTLKVRYTYTPISDNETELEYLESDEQGLASPFEQSVLEKLKAIMETE